MTMPTIPRQPMARLSQPEPEPRWLGPSPSWLVSLAAVVVIAWVLLDLYHQAHCVQLLGHWVCQ